jgi:hypothetical protein
MNFPLHLFRLHPACRERRTESVEVVTRENRSQNKPLFRAPALPTPSQLSRELPFTATFRPRLRERP